MTSLTHAMPHSRRVQAPRRTGQNLESVRSASRTVHQVGRTRPRNPTLSTLDISQLGRSYAELRLRFEPEHSSLWCAFRHREKPCFTPRLLAEVADLQTALRRALGLYAARGPLPVQVLVCHSDLPTIWNLGGDLALFVRLIRAGAKEELRQYAYACVDVAYANWTKADLPLLTVALVQGDALGGGFEAVLTNDVIIAERQSKFGLPEILFNLFPGMGAYTLLCRRLDGARAERMITSGRLYEAEELAAMGLVDLVIEPGEGEAAVRDYLARNQRRLKIMTKLSQVRRRCQPVTYEELVDVTDIWVEAAMELDEQDLRRMERLAAAQERRIRRADDGIETSPAAAGGRPAASIAV